MAHSLAHEVQNLARPDLSNPHDITAAATALTTLPVAERAAALDALAAGLQALPLAERAGLAAKLLHG